MHLLIYYIYIGCTHSYVFACKNAKMQNVYSNHQIIRHIEVCKKFCKMQGNAKVLAQKIRVFYVTYWILAFCDLVRFARKMRSLRPFCPFLRPKYMFSYTFLPIICTNARNGFFRITGILSENQPVFWLQIRISYILPTILMQDKMQSRCQAITRKNRR